MVVFRAMSRPILASLRSRLLVLVFFAGLPSLALILRTGLVQRQHAAGLVQDNTLRLAHLVSLEDDQFLTRTRQFLMTLAQVPAVRNLDSSECNRLFLKLARQNPAYANIGAVNLDGTVYCSAVPVTNTVNVADRLYFKRVLETREFSVGDYQTGRITGKASVNCGFPVLDDEGNLQAVVFAALDLGWLSKLAAQVDLPPGAALMALDRNGKILVRYPDSGKSVGQYLNEPFLMDAITNQQEGTARSIGPDGVERLYGFARLGQTQPVDVYVVVGTPAHLAYREANRMMAHNFIALGVVAVLALLAAWWGGHFFILRSVNELVATTHRLAQGDLKARTHLEPEQGEFGQLGHAFDEMAVALEQRVAERQRAADALRALNRDLEARVVARTAELSEKNEQMQSDLRMAREIQFAFLPQQYPCFPRSARSQDSALRFCHRYLPTGDIGGDFFDVLPLSDNEASVFICDVMGHGVRAALVTAMLRGLVEELAPLAHDPGQFLAEMNRALLATLRQAETTLFASAFYLVADVARGEICFANAGHPSPLRICRSAASVESFRPGCKPGPALGLFEDSLYSTFRRPIAADDLVILYTDGLYEVYDVDGHQYGEERLLAALRRRMRMPCAELFDELLKEIRAFSQNAIFSDDVCMVGMEVTRTGPPSPPAA